VTARRIMHDKQFMKISEIYGRCSDAAALCHKPNAAAYFNR